VILSVTNQSTTIANIFVQFSEKVVEASFPDILRIKGAFVVNIVMHELNRAYTVQLQFTDNYISMQVGFKILIKRAKVVLLP
jgi:hypothetical protein